jgi:hypothetical protein
LFICGQEANYLIIFLGIKLFGDKIYQLKYRLGKRNIVLEEYRSQDKVMSDEDFNTCHKFMHAIRSIRVQGNINTG